MSFVPFIEMARLGQFAKIKERILLGADVNVKDEQDNTALMWAAAQGHEAIVLALIAAKADLDVQEKTRGLTAVMRAAAGGHLGIVQALAEAGANLHWEDDVGNSLLQIAAEHNSVLVFKWLLATGSGADVNLANGDGLTPLMCAIERQNEDMARILIEGKADVDATCEADQTALMLAVRHGQMNMVRLLVNAKASIDKHDIEGRSPLILALGQEPAIAEFLIGSGASINAGDESGDNALMHCAATGSKEVARVLLRSGARLDLKNEEGYTALMHAARNGQCEMASMLIEAGADPQDRNDDGLTALDIALASDQRAMVELLQSLRAQDDLLALETTGDAP